MKYGYELFFVVSEAENSEQLQPDDSQKMADVF
jgi:hypothetical protein